MKILALHSACIGEICLQVPEIFLLMGTCEPHLTGDFCGRFDPPKKKPANSTGHILTKQKKRKVRKSFVRLDFFYEESDRIYFFRCEGPSPQNETQRIFGPRCWRPAVDIDDQCSCMAAQRDEAPDSNLNCQSWKSKSFGQHEQLYQSDILYKMYTVHTCTYSIHLDSLTKMSHELLLLKKTHDEK